MIVWLSQLFCEHAWHDPAPDPIKVYRIDYCSKCHKKRIVDTTKISSASTITQQRVVVGMNATVTNEYRLVVHNNGRTLASVGMDGKITFAPDLTLEDAKIALTHLADSLLKTTTPCSPG